MHAIEHPHTDRTRQTPPLDAAPNANDEALERWLREVVAPASDALKADPSRALTVAQVRAHLAQPAAEHANTV